jgi:quercetin dioxygenase-like cupin family protein
MTLAAVEEVRERSQPIWPKSQEGVDMAVPRSSHFARRAGGERSQNFLGAPLTFLIDSADTGGAYSLMEATLRPGDEPPPHVHTAEDEAYYILDGSVTFSCGETISAAEPGSLVFLPRGLQHAFTVHAEAARALVIISPGGLDAAFRELSHPEGAAEAPLPGQVLETFARYGVQFPAPPPDARP